MMSSAKKRKSTLTRGDSAKKKYGKPADLDWTEPPTSRQVINYFFFLKNSLPGVGPSYLDNQIAEAIVDIWDKVNPRLPKQKLDQVRKKVGKLRSRVVSANKKKISVPKQDDFEAKLDKLFDISLCNCNLPIEPCSSKCPQPCNIQHISCSCKANKVPLEERVYLKDQRAKIGPRGTLQLGPVDRSAVRRDARRTRRQLLQVEPSSSESAEGELSSSSSSPKPPADDEYHQSASSVSHSGVYNLLKTPKFACELVRHGVSMRAGASIFNAILSDLQSSHLLDESQFPKLEDLYFDQNKMKRQVKSVSLKASSDFSDDKEGMVCFGIDGRTDNNTRILKEVTIEGSQKIRLDTGKEHHLTFTVESGDLQGSYLTHRTLPLKGATGERLAKEAHAVLTDYKSLQTVKAVLCDNTPVNTGIFNFHIFSFQVETNIFAIVHLPYDPCIYF